MLEPVRAAEEFDHLSLPAIWQTFEATIQDLFPREIGGKRISLDHSGAEIDRFLVRLVNLAEHPNTVILLPMTGMERAFHFLEGFYQALQLSCDVIGVDVNRFTGSANLAGIDVSRNYQRLVVIDEECCHTYEKIMFGLFDIGYDLSNIRRVRLNDPLTLHVGGDMCISRVKRSDQPKSMDFSDAIKLWRHGNHIGQFGSPNYGLLQAIGLAQFAILDMPAPLTKLARYFSGHENLAALAQAAVTGSGVRFDAPRSVMESILGHAGVTSVLRESFLTFQRTVHTLGDREYDDLLQSVIAFETQRKEALHCLGAYLGKRAACLSGPQRFNLASLPYHWERPPEPFREAGI